jgi:hypothetical protein
MQNRGEAHRNTRFFDRISALVHVRFICVCGACAPTALPLVCVCGACAPTALPLVCVCVWRLRADGFFAAGVFF